jgi:DNA-binding transcriptional ArsR family regulator
MILQNIISGKSIVATFDDVEKRRGADVVKSMRKLQEKAVALEEYIKANLNFSDDETTAEFLFTERPRLEMAYALAFYFHERLKEETGINNKKFSIICFASNEKSYTESWDTNPPKLDTDKDFFDMLDAEVPDPAEKFELIKLYHNFDEYREYADNLLAKAAKLYKKKLRDFAEEINTCISEVEKGMSEKGPEFLKEKLNFTTQDDTSLTIYPSIYHIASLSLNTITRQHMNIIIGVHVFNLERLIVNRVEYADETTRDFLKTIADTTKLTILQLLKKEPTYGSRLAEKLNLTTATISHHMQALTRVDLVYLEKEGNRFYFHLNRKRLRELLDNLQKLFD